MKIINNFFSYDCGGFTFLQKVKKKFLLNIKFQCSTCKYTKNVYFLLFFIFKISLLENRKHRKAKHLNILVNSCFRVKMFWEEMLMGCKMSTSDYNKIVQWLMKHV